ncbi:hypothetical protein ACLOJK_015742 [Asimina triloba]
MHCEESEEREKRRAREEAVHGKGNNRATSVSVHSRALPHPCLPSTPTHVRSIRTVGLKAKDAVVRWRSAAVDLDPRRMERRDWFIWAGKSGGHAFFPSLEGR